MNARIWHAGDYPVAREALKKVFDAIWWNTDSATDRDTDSPVIRDTLGQFQSFDSVGTQCVEDAVHAAGEKAS